MKFDKARAKELCEKTSPAPWVVVYESGVNDLNGETVVPNYIPYEESGITLPDATFIAASRTLLPLAIERIEKLEEALREIQDCDHHQYCDLGDIKCPCCLAGKTLRDEEALKE